MKYKTGILGATGMVGQRFIQLLDNHPKFEISALMASERSAGKRYEDAASWYLCSEIPEQVKEKTVVEIDKEEARERDLDLVFSAVPSSVAEKVEKEFAEEYGVFSNASSHRMEEDVPLLVPEINPEHMDLIKIQQSQRGWDGFIMTNPNCSTIGMIIPLKPVYDEFGIKNVQVTTMQALSGAGYDGVPSMAIADNMLPYIGGEEEKVETEPRKILGDLVENRIRRPEFPVFASCNRIMVRDGHTEAIFLETEKDLEEKELIQKLSEFKGKPQELGLHSAPDPVIKVFEQEDRPQPIFDRDLGNGMAVSVGRIRKKGPRHVKFTCLSHNTVRGAAGASILNAELAIEEGYL